MRTSGNARHARREMGIADGSGSSTEKIGSPESVHILSGVKALSASDIYAFCSWGGGVKFAEIWNASFIQYAEMIWRKKSKFPVCHLIACVWKSF